MPDRLKRLEDHRVQAMASTSNPNELERRVASELLEARHALNQIVDLSRSWQGEDWKTLAARMKDIAEIELLD